MAKRRVVPAMLFTVPGHEPARQEKSSGKGVGLGFLDIIAAACGERSPPQYALVIKNSAYGQADDARVRAPR